MRRLPARRRRATARAPGSAAAPRRRSAAAALAPLLLVPLLLAPLLSLAGCTSPPAPAPTPTAPGDAIPPAWRFPVAAAHPTTAEHGMVVTDAPLASDVGARVLAEGGNAVDAAVATAFALAVVYPEAGNIGGGGFMVVRLADGTTASLDFREKAPLAATRDMYIGPDGRATDASLIGYRASGVPGSVMGLWEAHRRFGSVPWKTLLQPAIRLAEEGFTVSADFAGAIRADAARLRRFPASAALFLPGGEPPAVGSTWRDADLAATLRRIAASGPAGFYDGETAERIVAEMRRGGGLITREDLRRYRAVWREPIRFRYRGNEIVSMPPPSSGGITMAEVLNMLEGWNLDSLGWHSPAHLHLLAETMRRAFADRNSYLGDPDFVDFPQARLVSKAYARERVADIRPDRATRSADVAPGLGPVAEPSHTTHFSVVDAAGDAVATTTTLNALFGSGVSVAGAGFALNDEMDDFAAKPGTPNMFGLVQGEQNAIAPGKRMLSAMAPTIVVAPDGHVRLVTGARGGPRIITGTLQVISNVLDFGMDVGAAVDAPRVHHQHLPDTLYYEANGLTPAQIKALEAMGHHVAPFHGYIGNAPSILWADGKWTGIPDPRQGGSAAAH